MGLVYAIDSVCASNAAGSAPHFLAVCWAISGGNARIPVSELVRSRVI